MRSIYKYPVEATDAQFITMPSKAQILSVGEQNGNIVLWALVDTKTPLVRDYKILCFRTGYPAGNLLPGDRFIGTVQMSNGLVFHFWEAK